jgi:hypothetical protein
VRISEQEAILPVSAASPSGALCSGKKVHVQDQETVFSRIISKIRVIIGTPIAA